MKTKTILTASFLLLFLFNFDLYSQIKVFENNYVGINFSTTPSSRLVLNAAGSSAYQAWFFSPGRSTSGGGLATISDPGTGTGAHILGHLSQTNIQTANYHYGIKSASYKSTATSQGRTYGLYGLAGNAQNGYNYGVYGYLYGSAYGAAIFGTVNGLGDTELTGNFAGYFRGDVKCENIVYAVSFQTTSDEKFKTNIEALSPDILQDISKLNPVKYQLKQFEVKQAASDTVSVKAYYNESDQLFTKAKYGLIAQDLMQIYPDLVYKDNEDNLTIDYIGLIPIVIKALQAQQAKIEDLEEIISLLKVQGN